VHHLFFIRQRKYSRSVTNFSLLFELAKHEYRMIVYFNYGQKYKKGNRVAKKGNKL